MVPISQVRRDSVEAQAEPRPPGPLPLRSGGASGPRSCLPGPGGLLFGITGIFRVATAEPTADPSETHTVHLPQTLTQQGGLAPSKTPRVQNAQR